ncbi:helix-turn-helix transcriptional regulator [Halomicrobium sp. HM KBTZ05]|uniref:helix-turn-helix transcriptional regulator n=1 Tax=Halomicrobium sp. HM KBTZ05 TaxID=3242663 RepID=UPI003557B015
MHRQVLLGCLLVAALVSGAAVTTAQETRSSGLLVQPDGFDQTTFEITVTENGSARWSIQHHRRLANDSEKRQFRDFAERFESEETDLYRNFVSRSETLTAIGRNATGRPMAATSFDRDAYTNVTASFDDRGTIALAFTWTHFARTDGERVVVGDVFGENFYIGPDQSIVFVSGEGLQFTTVDPAPTSQTQPDSLTQSQSVTWEGEQQFAQQRPYLELEPRSAATTAAGGSGAEDDTQSPQTTAPLPSGTDNPMVWIVGAVILVLGVGSAIAYRNGSVSLPGDTASTASDTDTTSETAASATDSQTPIPDEELLSDSDRVVKLLESNGGRMKQVNIVEETDWSKSKVSMLLSDMEEDGEISKLRVGRENIISLAGHEPDAAGSPFDDEE